MKNKKLYRSTNDRIIAGVAGGLAEYLEFDATIIRLIFALLMFSGAGLVLYIIGWIIIPPGPSSQEGKDGADEIKETFERIAHEFRSNRDEMRKVRHHSFGWLGWFLVIVGAFLLTESIVGFSIWNHFWPMVIILLGFILLIKGFEY